MPRTSTPIPAYMPSPGEMILDELEVRGIAVEDLPEKVGELIRDQNSIDQELADLLENWLGISSEFWINLERQYRIYLQSKLI